MKKINRLTVEEVVERLERLASGNVGGVTHTAKGWIAHSENARHLLLRLHELNRDDLVAPLLDPALQAEHRDRAKVSNVMAATKKLLKKPMFPTPPTDNRRRRN